MLADLEIAKSDIDLFALHQPNAFLLGYLRKTLGVGQSQLPTEVDGLGNTSSSSIPLLLSRRHRGDHPSRNVILCGFGVGQQSSVLESSCNEK